MATTKSVSFAGGGHPNCDRETQFALDRLVLRPSAFTLMRLMENPATWPIISSL